MCSVALMLCHHVFTFSQIDLGHIVLVNLVYLCLTATMPTIFNTKARIVNGFDTRKALPYQLGIRNDILNDDKVPYGCGGILISSKFGITADHCVDDDIDDQGMSCKGACAHAHVRCAVARVRAKSILESVRDMHACGPFLF